MIKGVVAALKTQLTSVASAGGAAFYTGRHDGVSVIGWSTNLQSSRGVTREARRAIAERVAELAEAHRGA